MFNPQDERQLSGTGAYNINKELENLNIAQEDDDDEYSDEFYSDEFEEEEEEKEPINVALGDTVIKHDPDLENVVNYYQKYLGTDFGESN